MSNNIARYEKLKAKRPSIIRASALSFFYWLFCTLLSFAFLVLGVALFINAGFGNWLLSLLTATEINVMDEVLQRITYIVAGICIVLSILFFIIARLSKKIIRRTNYIVGLEEVMDSELNPEPNYVEV
jgi:O-antigen ligase